MKIRGLGRARQLILKARHRFAPPPLVLLYHRIAEVATDPQLLSVSPEHFCEHLAILQKSCCVLSYRELLAALRGNRVPPRAVAITFDDGYVDNLENAKPALEAAKVPAIVYIPTGFVGENRRFWWDQLESLLLHPGTLPSILTVTIQGQDHHYPLGEVANYDETRFQEFRTWNVLHKTSPTPRHAAYLALNKLFLPLVDAEQQKALRHITAQLSNHKDKLNGCRCVTHNELAQLASGDLLDFGAHTVTHLALGKSSVELQRQEIFDSRVVLESKLRRQVPSFSYPYGNYTNDTARLVAEAGFSDGVTTEESYISSRPSYFEIPRVVVRNWSGAVFAEKLRKWQCG
jgi:peptidoglycan/xylan/chitin deacetylase (PgdA/CDA1 family)